MGYSGSTESNPNPEPNPKTNPKTNPNPNRNPNPDPNCRFTISHRISTYAKY